MFSRLFVFQKKCLVESKNRNHRVMEDLCIWGEFLVSISIQDSTNEQRDSSSIIIFTENQTIFAAIEGELQYYCAKTAEEKIRPLVLIRKNTCRFLSQRLFSAKPFFPLFPTNGKYTIFPNGSSQHKRLSLLFHTIQMFVCTI